MVSCSGQVLSCTAWFTGHWLVPYGAYYTPRKSLLLLHCMYSYLSQIRKTWGLVAFTAHLLMRQHHGGTLPCLGCLCMPKSHVMSCTPLQSESFQLNEVLWHEYSEYQCHKLGVCQHLWITCLCCKQPARAAVRMWVGKFSLWEIINFIIRITGMCAHVTHVMCHTSHALDIGFS